MKKKKEIYLDYASYSGENPAYFSGYHDVANAGSIHAEGVEAKKALESARARVASAIGAHATEIVFTSTGTESNNLAIYGLFEDCNIEKPIVITTRIEHSSVIEPLQDLERRRKIEIVYLSLDEYGRIEIKELKEKMNDRVYLVAIMMVNNEIGTVYPTESIAKVIRDFKRDLPGAKSRPPFFFVDACQAPLCLPVNVEKLHADLLTINGNKIYAPGSAFLYRKRGVPLRPIMRGGVQEGGLRPGTHNVKNICALSKALESVTKNREKYYAHVAEMKDLFASGVQQLAKKYDVNIIVNSAPDSISSIFHMTISGLAAELCVLELDARGVYVSSMSACKEGEKDVSYVLQAIGKIKEGEEHIGGVRFSFGLKTQKADITYALKALEEIIIKYKGIYF